MTLREEIKSKKDALVALKERIEANDAEAIAEGEKLRGEIEAKTAELEQAEKKTALLGMIGTESKEDANMEQKKTALEEFTAKAAKVDKNEKGWSVAAHIKAATDVVHSVQMTDYDTNLVPQPRRVAAADFFTNATISNNAITYFKQGAYEGTPAVTVEGAKKPQNSTSFTPVTLPLSKIAAYLDMTVDEMLDEKIDPAGSIADGAEDKLMALSPELREQFVRFLGLAKANPEKATRFLAFVNQELESQK